MATIIVEDTRTNARGILLGAGFGMYRSAKPGVLGFEDAREGVSEYLAVTDRHGVVRWLSAEFARVVSVDGARPSDVLLDDQDGPPAGSGTPFKSK